MDRQTVTSRSSIAQARARQAPAPGPTDSRVPGGDDPFAFLTIPGPFTPDPTPPRIVSRQQSVEPAAQDKVLAVASSAGGSYRGVKSGTLDGIGMGLSALCAFKCMGVPIIASALSIGGLSAITHHPVIVWSVAGLALPVAAWRLVAREIKKGRVMTPLAATAASAAVTLGAIGHSLPASAKAPFVAGGCCGAPNATAESSHGHMMPSASGAVVSAGDLSLYEKVRANSHPSLLYGAIALGVLHLNVMARDFVRRRRRGPCGQALDDCACDPATSINQFKSNAS
jgi:hypothetical protein